MGGVKNIHRIARARTSRSSVQVTKLSPPRLISKSNFTAMARPVQETKAVPVLKGLHQHARGDAAPSDRVFNETERRQTTRPRGQVGRPAIILPLNRQRRGLA